MRKLDAGVAVWSISLVVVILMWMPALRGLDVSPVAGQAIVAAASGAAFTVAVSAVGPWRRR